ncbi:MAG: hypothetical protein QM736_28940 [Vicinamibacterales bacterium]
MPAIIDAATTCTAARLVGLMVLPPAVDDPQDARPYFTALRALRDTCTHTGAPEGMLRELSMGMSHDFEVAVEEGGDPRASRLGDLRRTHL